MANLFKPKTAAWLTATFAALAASRPAIAAEPEWQPARNWAVDFAAERCTAGRLFRSGTRELKLAFRPNPTSSSVSILIEVPGARDGLGYESGQVRFGEHTLGIESVTVTDSVNPGNVIISFSASRKELASLASAQRMTISSLRLGAELPITRFGPVLELLDRCVADLLTHWGLSVADQARLVKFPEPDNSTGPWLTNRDYPQTAGNREAVGQVQARVMVSPAGRASDCQMVRSSGHRDLDRTTCQFIVDRARSRPALDRDGKAMASPYYASMQFMMSDF